jgi:hypothetical protein
MCRYCVSMRIFLLSGLTSLAEVQVDIECCLQRRSAEELAVTDSRWASADFPDL